MVPKPTGLGRWRPGSAKQLANSVASLISVPIQTNYVFNIGAGSGFRFTANIQPFIPIALSKTKFDYRNILPVVHQSDVFVPLNEDDETDIATEPTSAVVNAETEARAFLAKVQRDMRQIDAGDVQRIIARMTSQGYEPKTIRNLWGVISLIWQAALAQKYVDAVFPKTKLPKSIKKKPRFFNLSDVARIIASSQGQQRCVYWLLAKVVFALESLRV